MQRLGESIWPGEPEPLSRHDCKRCEASGMVSDENGNGMLCPSCEGTARARPLASWRIRGNWGVKR